MKTYPDVECRVAQSESEKPCTSYTRTRRASSSRALVGQLIARHSMPTAYATSGRVRVEQ
eukprot:774674-Pleurochrysis_carterae.AAC.1